MRPSTLWLGAAISVAGSRAATAQAPTLWIVASTPVTSIGVAQGDPDQELAGVTGARRLSDGRVVVANGKPLELRVYNGAGKLLSRIGRRGDGPGEFRGRLDLLTAGGDSLLVYDQGSTRLMLFSADGKLAREWPPTGSGSARGQMVLFRRTLGLMIPAQLNHCLRQMVMALPPLPPPSLRTIRFDGAGRFWARVDTAVTWTVHSVTGQVLGAVRMPPGFELYGVEHGYLIGRKLLEDDVEQVQAFRVSTPRAALPLGTCAGVADSFPAATSDRATQLIKGLRNAMTAGEMAYSNYASYVSNLDSLPRLKDQLPGETVFRVLRASNRGWAAVLFDRRSTLVCLFGEADAVPAGWPDGAIRCSE